MDETSARNQKNTMLCPRCRKEFPLGQSKCPDDGTALITTVDPLIGSVFADKYEILSVLGQGGMSIVYKARHKYMDRVVAVKLLHEHLISDQLAFQRFVQESRAASSLSHQNVVNVHDFGRTPTGRAYFVMDCLEGASLADLLDKEGRVQINKAVDIFKQTCDGLEHAHQKGIIHRDLKPSNLVLIGQEDGHELVKIVDFGIAKLLPSEGRPSQQLTQTGEIFGSPLYMSPEQCSGKAMDKRSDIYSLGCLMYETLAGVPPLMGDSFINTVVKHINETPPLFEHSAPDINIPKPLEAVIMKCLSKNPDDRYNTASELRQSILDAALDSGVQGLRPGAVPDPSTRNTLGKTWERVKLSLSTTAANKKQAAVTMSKALFIVLPLVFCLFILGVLTFWKGPKGDQGNQWDKIRWQLNTGLAQQAIASRNYQDAKNLLVDAKKAALTLDDGQSRLRYTMEMLSDVYGKCGMFAEQEQANQKIADILTQEILAESKEIKSRLMALDKKSTGVQSTMNQLEAEANANRVLLCSKRLSSRGLYSEQESLLLEAIKVFAHLKIQENEQIAEFKTALADCISAEQRLTEVRPLLVDALTIRKRIVDLSDSVSTKKLIKSYLKLGQFDRDQSSYAIAQPELEEALNLTQKHFKSDAVLMVECLNSYADLLRQEGKTEESAKLISQAKALHKSIKHNQIDDLDSP